MPEHAQVDSPCCVDEFDYPVLMWKPPGAKKASPFFCKYCGRSYYVFEGKAVPA